MKIAILSPVAWRTPPEKYGPWEQIASNISEGLISRGFDVTLFATGNSITKGKLRSICPIGYEEDKSIDPKVAECLHIGYLAENANEYDIIHNNFDFLPLTYSKLFKTPMVTTIHGFSSKKIIEVYKKYNSNNHYVSISNSDRSEELNYISTVYNGIREEDFSFNKSSSNDDLLYFGRIHKDKGTYESIQIALKTKRRLIISGLIQDQEYFSQYVKPFIDNEQIVYVGNSGSLKRNEILGNAYALLHPISFKEPFGLSVAEAMYCGTPVIAFNLGSMPELIKHGETGFLCNTMEEASEIMEEVKNIDRQICHNWAKSKFTQEKMIEGYLKVYNKIIELKG